MGLLFIN